MQITVDLHVHSKYSRATSPKLGIAGLAEGAKTKGIDVIATGDFTHPEYFKELKKELKPLGNGLYQPYSLTALQPYSQKPVFILSQEIACIYSKAGQCRRIHIVVTAPSLEVVKKIIKRLEKIGNLSADGRPILGLDAKELVKIVLDASPDCLIIPGHIWTPWFSLYGSKSGFDAIEECFDELTSEIYAIETGLSSDPLMNWQLSALDRFTILSNGDAHSAPNLGREANVFELQELSYNSIIKAIKNSNKLDKNNLPKNYLKYTIEFYPEEGKYHWDGHSNCSIQFSPAQTKKQKNICPKCKKPLTVGVLNRVNELSDRTKAEAKAYAKKYRPDFKSLIPLREIIAEALNKGKNTKTVQIEYDNLIKKGESEFNVLLNLSIDEIKKITQKIIAEGLKRMRQGKVILDPGYDGVYGKIRLFKDEERENYKKQSSLF